MAFLNALHLALRRWVESDGLLVSSVVLGGCLVLKKSKDLVATEQRATVSTNVFILFVQASVISSGS